MVLNIETTTISRRPGYIETMVDIASMTTYLKAQVTDGTVIKNSNDSRINTPLSCIEVLIR